MQPTKTLAQFIAETRYDTLPNDVVAAAKIAILDGVANMLAGSTLPLADIITKHVLDMGGTPECIVVGRGCKTNPMQAAFANGVFLHSLDFEIQGVPPTHGTSACLPPALALGERTGVSGKRLIEAYVVGWEVQSRLRCAAARADLGGFHSAGIFGPMGAVASAARILALDATQVRMALGIAASHTGGLAANIGTMVKPTHPGSAARQGVEAALLAQGGYTSLDSIIEARRGYVNVFFGESFNWDLLTRDLGKTFQLVTPGFNIKRYPAQILIQWAIEAVLTLRQKHHIEVEDIDEMVLEIPKRAGSTRPPPHSGLEGKFSFEYCAAVALAEGEVSIDSFSDATRLEPRVEEALHKVRLRINPEIPRGLLHTWAVARVKTRDGRELSERCQNYRGSIANPMTREERLFKVRDCARRILGSEDVEQMIAMVEDLENQENIQQLMTLLCQSGIDESTRSDAVEE